MLSGITWEMYITWMAGITGGYYIVVGILYYRKDLLQLVQGRKSNEVPTALASNASKGAAIMRPGMPDTLIHQVHDLMEELKPVFADGQNDLGKPDLLARIQTRLHGYTRLKGSEFEDAVIHHIILEANEQCGVAVHAEEIKQIWN